MANILKNKMVKPVSGVNFSRSLFRYEKRHSTNMMAGFIVPVHTQFLYPGTSPDWNFGCVVESAPLISTCLDNIYIDIVCVWTPMRLVMTDWNEFLGESHSQAFTINRNITIPKIDTVTVTTFQGHTISRAYLADHFLAPHLGYRMHSDITFSTAASVTSDSIFKKGISVIPSRIYELNWNTFFRNENIQAPILIDKTSTVGSQDATYQHGLGPLRYANKLKTFYTVATPNPSLLDVSIALDQFIAPVFPTSARMVTGAQEALRWSYVNGLEIGSAVNLGVNGAGKTGGYTSSSTGTLANLAYPDNLAVDLSNLTVNRMYYALMEQRFANKMMKGRRAVEFYENFFGIKGSDAGHDLPLLLTHKRFPINVSQVIATASGTNGSETSDLGQRGAFSSTGFGDSLVHNFTATEHGYIQTYAIIRGQPSLYQGIDHNLGIDGLLDTYIPEFDHIGPVGIERLEVTESISGTANTYFGYTNAWYSERNQISDVCGIMEPGQPLSYKTLAHEVGAAIGALNTIQFTPNVIDRLFMFPVLYGTPGDSANGYDILGGAFNQTRYQFLVQFAVKGKFAAVMSPDSEPLKLRL